MESNPQAAAASQKPLRVVGVLALMLGFAHAWLAAMHWNQHTLNVRAFEFAAIGVLVPFLFAFAIAGRTQQRDWNKIALWFLLWSMIILPFLTHVRLAA